MDLFTEGHSHKTLIGMIHAGPLPGTPFHKEGSFGRTVEDAVASATALYDAGADGCLIQTVDRVYPVVDEADPARIAAMGILAQAVRRVVPWEFRIGIQIMRNANCAAIGVAHVAGCDFIRATALVGTTMSPHGLVRGEPDRVMRYRAALRAERIAVVADIATMHFSWFGEKKGVGDIARAAQLVGASAVAVSHDRHDQLAENIEQVREAVPDMPILLAGGCNLSNLGRLMPIVDGAFVGTAIERDGWGTGIDRDKAAAFVEAARRTG